MKIVLIMVKGNTYSFRNRPFIFKNMPDSLTMGMLYAIIKWSFPEIEVEVIDETVEEIKKEEINADLIGISALTPAFYKAQELSKYFRAKGIPVFIGGLHATLAPETCYEDFDSIIIGLANESLVQLIYDFKNGNLQKEYRQRADMPFENFVFPDRTLYEKKDWRAVELNMVQATYGCSNACKFCVQPYVSCGYHQRPVEDVLVEISKINTRDIEFVDPNFARDIKYLEKMCKGLKKLKKSWFAPMTMTVGKNEKLLRMLKDSGCSGVLVGFESVNLSSIDTISKGFNNISQYEEVVKNFHKYGIEVTGSFVMGLDGDDKDTEKATLDFIIKTGIDYVRFTINTPFPGTEYYNEMKNSGRVITEDYRKYDCCHCVIKPQNLTPEEVETLYKNMWKKSYTFINVLRRICNSGAKLKFLKLVILNYIFGKVYQSMVIKSLKN